MTNYQNRWRASKDIQQRARELRKNMTAAEKKLWQVLRGNQLDGLYFRRQHAIGTYILDFVCVQEKLVVEVDGGTHLGQEEFDKERTRWLEEEKGYRVIRFTNDDVLRNINAVVEMIRDAFKNPYSTFPVHEEEKILPPHTGGVRGG